MTPHEPHDDLRRLLAEAVDDIEPRSGIEAIRSRTHTKETTVNPTRTWLLGALGAAAATAAVITGVVMLGPDNTGSNRDPDPAPPPTTQPTEPPSDEPTQQPTDPPTSGTGEPVATTAVGVYYAGQTPQGVRLYREFQRVAADGKLLAAANAAASGKPADTDYRSLWPAGTTFDSVSLDGVGADGVIQVVLKDESLHDRPSGMTEAEASLAIEQIIYTLQGAVGARAPVQFRLGSNPIDQVLGVPTSEPLANGLVTATLALVNLTTPAEGQVITGDTLEVSGVANSFEATVPIRLQRFEGMHIALEDFITAEGCCEEKLFPFSKTLDISGVAPGKYILQASTDDPSGGAEGAGPHVDTKVITIK